MVQTELLYAQNQLITATRYLGLADPGEGPEGEALPGEVLRELVGAAEEPEAGGLAGHLRAAVVVRHFVVVEQGVAAPAENYT